MDDKSSIEKLLRENERRQKINNAPFNPVTGENSIGERKQFLLPDFPIAEQWLPIEMMQEPLVKRLKKAGSVAKFLSEIEGYDGSEEQFAELVEEFCRLRNKYDYPFWCATLVYIKRKGGGKDILFRLNRPQRRLVERLERMRKAGKPIRLVLLKARQWGGSTCIQMYMAWLQMCHVEGLNSLIIAHQSSASDKIKAMFKKMISAYPLSMLHKLGDVYPSNEKKYIGVGNTGSINRIPQRNCDINVGTAESAQGPRSGDYNLLHLSEVGLWPRTEKMDPEDIVRSATTGVLYAPNTMIAYESTPDGAGTFFHEEYLAAKNGESQYEALFIAWWQIEQYEIPFESKEAKREFAKNLYANRKKTESSSVRKEPGSYLWWLWEIGATLEGIQWYIQERTKFTSHGGMASEYPSDDIEAFTFSGKKVFADEDIAQFKSGCRKPRKVGEIYGRADSGEEALQGLRFRKEEEGELNIWHDVERDEEEIILDRYLVVVDVCKGTTENADYADILVLDRLPMMDGDGPVVAAEWHGHIDMDRLAWKAAQVAAYYNNAQLVIESNTLETNKNTKGEADYILTLIGEVYDNLYARKQSAEDIRQGLPRKYGFHTNPVTKKKVIYNLKVAVREKLYTEREAECLVEYATYLETENGVFEAKKGHHDDRVMTRAIGLHISTYEMDLPRVVKHDANKATKATRPMSESTI